jgi:hypothetical protein
LGRRIHHPPRGSKIHADTQESKRPLVLLGIGWSTLAIGASLIAIGFSEAGPVDRGEPAGDVGTGSRNESVPSWAWFLLPGTAMVVGGGVVIDFGTGSADLVARPSVVAD